MMTKKPSKPFSSQKSLLKKTLQPAKPPAQRTNRNKPAKSTQFLGKPPSQGANPPQKRSRQKPSRKTSLQPKKPTRQASLQPKRAKTSKAKNLLKKLPSQKSLLKKSRSQKGQKLIKTLRLNPGRPARSHHDKFFKRIYSDLKLARELCQLALSKEEFQACDWKKLKIEKHPHAKADLILSVPLKDYPSKQIKILFIWEHKAWLSKKVFKQMLLYQTILYSEPDQVLTVIPILFNHGKKPWKWKKSFQEVYLGEFFSKIPVSFRRSVLNYELRLLDTRDERVRRIFKDKRFKSGRVLHLLSKIWDVKRGLKDELSAELKEILLALFKVFSGDEKKLTAVGQYLMSAGVNAKEYKELLKEAINTGSLTKGGYMDMIKDFEQAFREELQQIAQRRAKRRDRQMLKKGMEKGRQEGMEKAALNMLGKKADISFISEVTGLTKKAIKKLKNGS